MIRFYNLTAGRFRQKCWNWGITCMLLTTVAITNSYTQCDQANLACNDFVQVSLDTECKVKVTPDMILEGALTADSFYRVTIWNGSIPLGDSITDAYVNRRLEVSVRCMESGVSCWGYIGVEDKLPPVIEVFPPMVMVDCDEADELLQLTDSTGNPFAFIDSFFVDNGGCEKIDTLMLMSESTTDNGACGENGVVRTLTLTFMATDKAGNVGTSTQVVVVKKPEMSDVNFPTDTVISCIDLPANGFDPAVFGEPGSTGCDIFKSTYTDTRFPLCGGSFKILRTWTVVDWCDGRDTTVQQILESLDTVAPVWNMNFETMTGSTYTGSQACLGSITIPVGEYAAATDLCYALQVEDYTVRYRKADTTQMDGFSQQIFTDVIVDPINYAVTIENLPLGLHEIIVTATDACGNSSTGTRQFSIEDNTPPNAICERTTTAVLDFNGLGEMMAFTLDDHSFDNCSVDRFEVKRLNSTCEGFEDDLNFGPSVHFCCDDIENNPIKVVLRVYDSNDRYSECVVDVEVQDKRPVVLNCRPDITVDCGFNFNDLEARLGTPTVQADVCNIEDPVLQPFTPEVDECGNGEFYVTWTISDGSVIRDSCKQKVTVRNLSNPTITIPGNINIEGCDASQAHPKFIGSEPTITSANCEMTASSWVDEIDEMPNSGCIRITRMWTVIDWCTYVATDPSTALRTGTQIVTLTDNVAPTVIDCPASVTVADTDDNCVHMVELRLRATDNCTLSDDLVFSYSIDLDKDGTVDSVGSTNDATDIYPTGTHSITWTVTDKCGNMTNSCAYDFTVMKAEGSTCDGGANLIAAALTGVLTDENDIIVPNASVTLRNRATNAIEEVTTNNRGEYQFGNLNAGYNYDIKAGIDGNDGLGITAIDVILIQRHILGLGTFQSPYQVLAADVNSSKSITASDLISLQRVILGLDNNMNGTDSWKFVPKGFSFDANAPFDYPATYTTGGLLEGINALDFVGVKVGDVNGNAFPALLSLDTDPRSTSKMMYHIGKVSEGMYKVDFYLPRTTELTGMQMSINAEAFDLADKDNGAIIISNQNIALYDDQIRLVWTQAEGTTVVKDEVLFSFLINGDNIDALTLHNAMRAELYDSDLETHKISLQKDAKDEVKRGFEIFQNNPNPFELSTQISFMLPERDHVSFKVFDMTGKVLLQKEGTYDRGINSIDIHKNELTSTGVLYYTIETSSEIKGQRMILLH